MINFLANRPHLYLKNGMKNYQAITSSASQRIISAKKCSNESQKKPLVLFLPFLGASKSAIEKYVNMYEDYGCQVVVHNAKITDFVWPSTGLNNSFKFLETLEKSLQNDEIKPVIVHSMSIGCYFYGLMLINMHKNPENFQILLKSIKGQIVDSPVLGTLKEMAVGLSKSLFKNLIMRKMLELFVMLYFASTKSYTVKFYNDAIDTFFNKPLPVDSIIYTTKADPLALPEKFEELVQSWKVLDIEVFDKVWTESEHASNLRTHPSEYTENIYKFLDILLNGSLKSKL